MRMIRAVEGVAFLGLVASCIPVRDNPNDPARAPKAAIRIVDEGGQEIFTAPRGTRFAMDASESTDPQGDDLSYSFFVVTSGEAIAIVEDTSSSLVPVPEIVRYESIGPRELMVRVEDDGGAHSSASILFTVTNSRPSAIAPEPRTVPLGGLPWSLGEPFQVAFPAAAEDADGPDEVNHLTYCWTFPPELTDAPAPCPVQDATVCSSDPNAAEFTRCIDSTISSAVRATATLTVSDGVQTSLKAVAALTIGTQSLWYGSGVDFGPFERFDTLRHSYPGISSSANDLRGAFLDRAVPRAAILVPNFSGADLLLADLDGNVFDSIALTEDEPDVDAAIDGSGVWISFRAAGATQALWVPVASDGNSFLAPVQTTGPACKGDAQASTSGGSDVWIISVVDTSGVWVSSQGASVAISPGPDRIFVGIAGRPGSDEAWAMTTQNWLVGGSPSDPALLRWTDPQLPPIEIPMTRTPTGSLAWNGPDQLWVAAEDGLVLVDATLLETGLVSFEDAIVLELPTVVSFFQRLTPDPSSDAVWTTSVLDRTVTRFHTTGSVDVFPYVTDQVPALLFVDGEGGLWFDDKETDRLLRGLTPSADGASTRLSQIGQFKGEPDIRTGAFWAPGLFPTNLRLIAEDGTVLHSQSQLSYSGGLPEVFPFLGMFRVAPGTDTVYGAPVSLATGQTTGIWRWDGRAAAPDATLIVPPQSLGDFVFTSENSALVFEPSAPTATTSTAFIWTVTRAQPSMADPTPPILVRTLTPDGVLRDPLLVIPGTEVQDNFGSVEVRLRAARNLSTNALCVANVEDDLAANRFVHVRRVRPDGAIETLGTIPLLDDENNPGQPCQNYSLNTVGSAFDGTTEVCWVALQESCFANFTDARVTFTAFDAPASIYRQYVETGISQLRSMATFSPTKVIYSAAPTDFEIEGVRVILDDPDGASFRREVMYGERAQFLWPESK